MLGRAPKPAWRSWANGLPCAQPLSVADFLHPEGEDPTSARAKAGNDPDQVHPAHIQIQTPTLIRAHIYCCAKATVGW
jgi:hypothetical protein